MSTTIMKHDEVYNTYNCMVRLGRAVNFHIMESLIRIKRLCNVDIHVQHKRCTGSGAHMLATYSTGT